MSETKKIEIPLLKDHHSHLSIYGLLYGGLDLKEIVDKDIALQEIRKLNKERISIVTGWNTGYYHFSEEELAPLPPVIIVNLSLHSFLLSPAAISILEKDYPLITANYKDPQWFEEHMPEMLIFLANQAEVNEEKFDIFFDSLFNSGVYYAEEMHLANEKVFSVLRASPYAHRTTFWTDLRTYKSLNPSIQREMQGIKFFCDGAVGAKSAALEKPFKSGEWGYLLYKDEELFQQMVEASTYGAAIAAHAIGEKATNQVVKTVRKLKTKGITFPFIRMEHCQFIHRSTAIEAKKLGITLSMQPNFSTDSDIYTDRLSPWYLENNNPFRMLIDVAGFVPGEDLLFGSDGMPHGAEEALKASLFPSYPVQRLSLDEFIGGYCMPDKKYGCIEIELSKDNLISISVKKKCYK